MKKIARLFHTLKFLKPTQLAFFVRRRLLPAARVSEASNSTAAQEFSLSKCIPVADENYAPYAFNFIGTIKKYSALSVDWRPDDVSRLWRYNLHYFDYLREPARPVDEKNKLIENWIDSNPQGSQPGWEPFTASLRIVNWIIFASVSGSLSQRALDSLYTQARWLFSNDERHILANHYFENLKAMLFAGCYFEGDEPARWRSRALQEIPEQLQEQMLPDGGHYERSPQYHCLMVENILDILNLAQNNPSRIGKAFPAVLRQHAESALAFIEDIAPADTLLPLFNDSAQGIAPEVSALQRYAKHLFGYVVNAGSADPHVVCRADFGLIGFRTAQAALLFDCGEPGPKYQPGHTHCDLLSFELAWGGLPLIVDTGVCEYEPGPRRHYLRSTAAHNTISIDGLEQSEIWGEFRVARRARVTRGSIKLEGNFSGVASLKIEGSFEGFFPGTWRDRPGFRHQRQIYVKLVKGGIESLEVVDTIAEVFARSRSYCLESFLHFHPDVLPEVVDGKRVSISIEGGPLLELVPPESAELEIVESIYCPRFGEVINNKCLVVREQVTMPHRMVYRIRDLSAS